MGFLKLILVLILTYYLLKILARWFAPKLFAYAARKTEERFREQFGNYQKPGQEEVRQPGEVSIDKRPTRNKTASKDVGEYIDFEEID